MPRDPNLKGEPGHRPPWTNVNNGIAAKLLSFPSDRLDPNSSYDWLSMASEFDTHYAPFPSRSGLKVYGRAHNKVKVSTGVPPVAHCGSLRCLFIIPDPPKAENQSLASNMFGGLDTPTRKSKHWQQKLTYAPVSTFNHALARFYWCLAAPFNDFNKIYGHPQGPSGQPRYQEIMEAYLNWEHISKPKTKPNSLANWVSENQNMHFHGKTLRRWVSIFKSFAGCDLLAQVSRKCSDCAKYLLNTHDRLLDCVPDIHPSQPLAIYRESQLGRVRTGRKSGSEVYLPGHCLTRILVQEYLGIFYYGGKFIPIEDPKFEDPVGGYRWSLRTYDFDF